MSAEVVGNTTDSTPVASVTKNNKKDSKTSEEKKKRRVRKKTKKPSRKPTLKTKVVVRRLPPNLPEEIFNKTVQPWVNEETVDYSLYIPGKLTKSKAKESIFSRAYFHFKSVEAVISFHQGFDGHIFIDSRGVESRAVVEFAPYQKIPKEHKTPDSRQGTIDEDQDYLSFLESLKAEEKAQSEIQNEPVDGLTQIERLENRIALVTAKTLAAEQANKPKTTPLLEHLRAQKAAQAAAKSKAAARKNERKKVERQSSKKNDSNKSEGVAQPTEPPTESKKKRERHRKKKDGDSAKKSTNENEKTPNANGASNSNPKNRPPKESKPRREQKPSNEQKSGNESKPSRPPKEGGNSKPKRQNNKKQNNEDNEKSKQRPPIKILARQPSVTTTKPNPTS